MIKNTDPRVIQPRFKFSFCRIWLWPQVHYFSLCLTVSICKIKLIIVSASLAIVKFKWVTPQGLLELSLAHTKRSVSITVILKDTLHSVDPITRSQMETCYGCKHHRHTYQLLTTNNVIIPFSEKSPSKAKYPRMYSTVRCRLVIRCCLKNLILVSYCARYSENDGKIHTHFLQTIMWTDPKCFLFFLFWGCDGREVGGCGTLDLIQPFNGYFFY